jgi:hypothetical protein
MSGALLEEFRAALPAPAAAVTRFWDRPYRTVDDAVSQVLLADITDPQVAGLPVLVGSIAQWASSVDVLASPARRSALRSAYRALAGPGRTDQGRKRARAPPYCAVRAGLSRTSRTGFVSSSSAMASRDFTKSENDR